MSLTVIIRRVYAGSRRKASEKWGCWVWLRHDIHMDLHSRNSELDLSLRRVCQERFEELYGHERFMQVFGKSYLKGNSGFERRWRESQNRDSHSKQAEGP